MRARPTAARVILSQAARTSQSADTEMPIVTMATLVTLARSDMARCSSQSRRGGPNRE